MQLRATRYSGKLSSRQIDCGKLHNKIGDSLRCVFRGGSFPVLLSLALFSSTKLSSGRY